MDKSRYGCLQRMSLLRALEFIEYIKLNQQKIYANGGDYDDYIEWFASDMTDEELYNYTDEWEE